MNGRTNAKNGSGSKAFAAISVTYPVGSTCACTDGAKKLKLKDASGQGFFLIPYAGTWTVMCYDGADYDSSEKKKSKVVEITSEGQSESVIIIYKVVYYENGTEYIAFEPIKDSVGSNYGSIVEGGNSININTDKFTICIGEISNEYVDLSNISGLACKVTNPQKLGNLGSGLRISVCETKTSYNNKNRTDAAVIDYAVETLEDSKIYTLDVSAVSGGYIGIYGYGDYSAQSGIDFSITEIYGT